jgi:hypothetical protein
MSFLVTKEKLVFAVALVVSLGTFAGTRKPSTEDVPKIPPEEAPRPPRVTVPVPALHPEKPLEAAARDPFVPASAWSAATPARLGSLPEPAERRILPGGPRGAVILVDSEPKAQEPPK